MPLLTKAQIFGVDDLPSEVVSVPEWGGEVKVRALTGTDRDRFEADLVPDHRTGRVNRDNLRARLVALAVVDEEGKRLFTDGDAAELGRKSATALTRVFEVAQKLSGLTNADVEELAGN